MLCKYIKRFFNKVFHTLYGKSFQKLGSNTMFYFPLRIDGKKDIIIHDDVIIQSHSWIASISITPDKKSKLEIGKGCIIGNFNELYATKSIVIENNVLTADRVYISDNLHGYENPDVPILSQPITQNGDGVRIGEGSWIGVGAVILGANIGKHCVIGSNAVVTHDVPDYSIAVGIPARIIKKYDFNQKKWIKV